MALTRRQVVPVEPTGGELQATIARNLGLVPQADEPGNVVRPRRWNRRHAGQGELMVINRPGETWAWLTRRKEARQPRPKGTVLLVAASLLVLALAAGQGYVSWFAQFQFIDAAKHAPLASGIEALGLDTGAVIFALLALALVRLHRRAVVPRILNVSCAAGSLAMNVLGADLTSPRSIAIYALPSALYATASDQLIAVVRRHTLAADVDEAEQRSAWAMAWRAIVRVASLIALTVGWVLRLPLYLLRLVFAPGETWGGLRQLVLTLTPLPEAEQPAGRERPNPGNGGGGGGGSKGRDRRGRGDRKGGPTKKTVLLKLYAAHPAFGDRSQITAVTKELAPQARMTPSGARTYVYQLLNATQAADLPRVRRELLEGSATA